MYFLDMYFSDMYVVLCGAESKRIKYSTAPESCGKTVEQLRNSTNLMHQGCSRDAPHGCNICLEGFGGHTIRNCLCDSTKNHQIYHAMERNQGAESWCTRGAESWSGIMARERRSRQCWRCSKACEPARAGHNRYKSYKR